MKAILSLLFATYVLAASPVTISEFSDSLDKHFGLNSSRLDSVISKVRIRKPNAFERWMMNKSGAEATYNDKTNTIVLREKNWRGNRIVGASDFPQSRKYEFDILASTIFHELMHADFDVLVKGSRSTTEEALSRTQDWFRANARGTKSLIATHEFFGYTASDLIIGVKSNIQDLLLAHGINSIKNSCFGEKGLARIKARLFPDGDIRFKDTLNIVDYSKRFTPSSIFIKGKGLDLNELNFPDHLRRDVYEHFVKYYQAPRSSADLLDTLEREYGNLLRECYSNL